MIINLKELSNVLSQLSDLVAGDKTVSGVLFDVKDTEIKVCYADNAKVFCESVPVETTENDTKDKIIFNYQALTRIIEACKPTGKIITDTIEFEFCDKNVIKVKAEKKIPYIVFDEVTQEEKSINKIISVTEQTLSWIPNDSPRVAMLTRENYELLHHLDAEYIEKKYESASIKPLSTAEWNIQKDSWDAAELKSILSKLAIENGKIIYISPSSQKAFVHLTSGVICLPVKSEINHKMMLSTSVAKSLSSILGKINTDDGVISVHMVDADTVAFSIEDNTTALSLRNNKQDNLNIIQLNNYLAKDYSKFMLTFNREVLQSCLYGAKTAGASDKAVLAFEKYTEESEDGPVTKVKMLITARNTTNSTDNKYEVTADYAVDIEGNLDTLKLNSILEIIFQAVSRAESDYITFDINIEETGKRMVRIAEIDLEKRAEVSEREKIEGGWSNDEMAKHRTEILGYTTFITLGTE